MVTGHVRWVVVLSSNASLGISLGGLGIGLLKRVVVLRRWSFVLKSLLDSKITRCS